ncbi:MAG: hemolysin family protein [Rhabdochlamydiaceae bacterium]
MLNLFFPLCLFFLLISSLLEAAQQTFIRLGRLEIEHFFSFSKKRPFYFKIIELIAQKKEWSHFLFGLRICRSISLISYGLLGFIYWQGLVTSVHLPFLSGLPFLFCQLLIALLLILSLLSLDLIFHTIAVLFPKTFVIFLFPLTCPFLILFYPFTFAFVKIFNHIENKKQTISSALSIRDKMIDFFKDAKLEQYLDNADQSLIISVASFKDKIVREIMVPRINVFSLPHHTKIKEALSSFVEEGYSRIPVYKESLDEVMGVLLYKDVLNLFVKKEDDTWKEINEDSTIEKLIKPILHTPESKKISSLLQEFKNQQMHLAIVVDEYGGTEGIVTIEDILEELVGEIADEYDHEGQPLCSYSPTGEWIIDPRIAIFDLEKETGIKIPQGHDYDTVAGYIFHRLGNIPSKGVTIHHDEFDLEILSSDERRIETIKITVLK